ncbi:MAG: AAA family ATPase [Burkholderiaceae bacterium]|nr:AAA family ATPase [Burkholderiaceae bacterium]
MLRKIAFKNYRCFEKSELDIRKITVIVCNNNAGKSTVIEALRIVASVSQRFKNATYVAPPAKLHLPAILRGISLNLANLKIDLRTVVYQYLEETNAEIIATFDNGTVVKVFLCSDTAFAILESNGQPITKKADARQLDDLNLYVMPQIGLIREDEPMLSPDTVRRDIDSRLSSRHFRNELWLYRHEHFDTFKQIAQSTWNGLRITSLTFNSFENKIELLVYDSDYAAEIGLMGSGLQMWLQIVWFISRCPTTATIILDEPDVYMHPDLQRKILRIVKSRFPQIIVATHSVEIISDVEPHQIVTVDKKTRRMQYANSFKAVQTVINNLGSEHNLSLIRLGNARKCLFVEGKDIKTLSKLQSILSPQCDSPLDQLPTVSLGGWSRFNEALGAARLFYEETNGEIKTFCILDHDYHTDSEVAELYRRAAESHLTLHVWDRKEIENYILSPVSIFRLTGLPIESYDVFCEELFSELDSLYDQTLGGIMDQLWSSNRSKMPSTFLDQAKEILDSKWSTLEGRLSVANGKNVVSTINTWLKTKYNKSSSRTKLLGALSSNDIASEVKELINILTT